ACAWLILLNGAAVALFGVVILVLYVDLSVGEVALYAGVSALALAAESALAAAYFLRTAEPARVWLGGARSDGAAPSERAWSAAAGLPRFLVGRPILYVVGALGAAAADLLVAALLGLSADRAVLLFPVSYLLYLSSSILRYVGLELAL